MSTAKRDRQRENRRRKIEANQAAAKRYASRRRIAFIGYVAVVVAIAAVAIIWVTQDDDTTEVDVAASAASEADATPVGEAAGSEAFVDAPTDEDASDDEAASLPSIGLEVAEPSDEPPAEGECPEPNGSSRRILSFDGPQNMCIDPEATYTATFFTSEGDITFELTAAETPQTVNNFVNLARWHYYDDTLLFRTDPSIDIIQGGSPTTNSPSDPGPGYTIPDEPTFDEDPATGALTGPYEYEAGQLVMARSAGRDAAGAQFFITTGPNAAILNQQGTYVVFGKTDDAGLEVAKSIIDLHVPTGNLGGEPSREVRVYLVAISETPAAN